MIRFLKRISPFSAHKRRRVKLQVSSRLRYRVPEAGTLILSPQVQQHPQQKIRSEELKIEQPVKWEEIKIPGGSRFVRFDTGPLENLTIDYQARVDLQLITLPARRLPQRMSMRNAAPSSLEFLNPSRYCESDAIENFARQNFPSPGQPALDRVRAVMNWVHANLRYDIGATNALTTSAAVLDGRAGVCRDYTHLAISLCRALELPARYLSCYAAELSTPTFHACAEVLIGDRWWVFDPSRLSSLNGLVRIGAGRDAADTAVVTSSQEIENLETQVACKVLSRRWEGLRESDSREKMISLSRVNPAAR